MVEHLLNLSPRYVVTNDEEYARCKAAFALLQGAIVVFLMVADDEDKEEKEEELTPWERYERRAYSDDEGAEGEFSGPPDEIAITIREHSCDCHGITYSIRMHAPWPFRFQKMVDKLSIGPGGCRFEIKETRFHVIVPMPIDDD